MMRRPGRHRWRAVGWLVGALAWAGGVGAGAREDAAAIRGAFAFGGRAEGMEQLEKTLGRIGGDHARMHAVAKELWSVQALRPLAREALRRVVRVGPREALYWEELAAAEAFHGAFEEAAGAQFRCVQLSEVEPEAAQRTLRVYAAAELLKRGLRAAAGRVLESVGGTVGLTAAGKGVYEGVQETLSPGEQRVLVGVVLEELPEGRPGVGIQRVVEGSPAARAGLRAGDELRKIGHDRVLDVTAASRRIDEIPVGGRERFLVRRGGSLEFVEVERTARAGAEEAEGRNAEGVARAAQGDMQGALVLFDEARALDPGAPKAWFNRGLALERLGDPRGAATSYMAALALEIDEATAARLAPRVGALVQAAGGNAASLFPEEVRIASDTAVSLARGGQHVKAFFAFLEVLQDAPGFPNALLGAGGVEEALGMRELAVEALEAYLRVLPQAPNRSEVLRRIAALRSGLTAVAPAPVARGGSDAPRGRPPPAPSGWGR